MPVLTFNAADVRRVVEHSLANKQADMLVDYHDGKPIMAPPPAPSVLLVHDQGVYLMSNGTPRDIVQDITSFCAYAHGCDPSKDAAWYDTAHDLVGGDDFGETLPWAAEIKAILDRGASHVRLLLDGESIGILQDD